MLGTMGEVLNGYPAQPPQAASSAHYESIAQDAARSSTLLDTPKVSPPSAPGLTSGGSNTRPKKVNFSPSANYIKPPSFTDPSPVRTLPRSSECRPAKSILKPTASPPTTVDTNVQSPQPTQSLSMLLESTTHQLAGELLSSRIDAYMQLVGMWKSYEDVPVCDALVGKLDSLCHFIQRDVTRDFEKDSVMERNLVIYALKLGILLACNKSIAAQLPDEFRVFMIDHALNALQECKLPKAVLNLFAHTLAQGFPQRIMSTPRWAHILSVMNEIHNRVSGNNILIHRLNVYQHLPKPILVSHPELWIENLIASLLHSAPMIRTRAIELGNKIIATLGPNTAVSKAVLDYFDKELPEGRRMVSEIRDRMLLRLMTPVENGVHVPQIWAILVLLMRSRKFRIEQWHHFKEWTLVAQRCFNCSEPAIKTNAFAAWDRFVAAIGPNVTTSRSMLKRLSVPILSHIERKIKIEKRNGAISPTVLSSYYNLLYYGFHPSNPFERIDFLWECYVQEPVTAMFASVPELTDCACRALSSLLWSSQPKAWNEHKVDEGRSLDAEHLLPLDCRWVRSRVSSVLKVIDVLLRSSDWKRCNGANAPIETAWLHLCQALADASNKDLIASADLMQAIASVLGLFQRIWRGGPSSLNAWTADEFLDRFSFLAGSMISTIGPAPFTEKLLLKTAEETFQAANTPTRHRTSQSGTNLDSPFMHLLRLISSHDLEATESYSKLVNALLQPAYEARSSRGSRLEFLVKCTEVCSAEVARRPSRSPALERQAWEVAAQLTARCLRSFSPESMRDRSSSVTREYGNLLKIIARGACYRDAHATWESLVELLVRMVRVDKEDRGIAMLVIEPLAAVLLDLNPQQICLHLETLISQATSVHWHRHNPDRSSERPDRGVDVREELFPNKLLEAIERVLVEYYKAPKAESADISRLMESLASLLGHGLFSFSTAVLDRIQASLALWIRDAEHRLAVEDGADKELSIACRTLSRATVHLLQTAISHNTSTLRRFQTIVSAGLASVHKSTANRFIEMWNTTFGLQSITYPPAVQEALHLLKGQVGLQLSCHSSRPRSEADRDMPKTAGSQVADSAGSAEARFDQRDSTGPRSTIPSSSPVMSSAGFPAGTHGETTPRHRIHRDDFHAEFMAVGSSPTRSAAENEAVFNRKRASAARQDGDCTSYLPELPSSSPALPSPARTRQTRRAVQKSQSRDGTPLSEVPLTPSLGLDSDDVFTGSSPTPGAKHQAEQAFRTRPASIQALEKLEAEIPSSPPEIREQPPRDARRSLQLQPASPTTRGESVVDEAVSRKVTPESTPRQTLEDGPAEHSRSDTESAPSQRESPAARESTTSFEVIVVNSHLDDTDLQVASQLELESRLAASFEKDRPSRKKRKAEGSSGVDRSKRRSTRKAGADLTSSSGSASPVSSSPSRSDRSTPRRSPTNKRRRQESGADSSSSSRRSSPAQTPPAEPEPMRTERSEQGMLQPSDIPTTSQVSPAHETPYEIHEGGQREMPAAENHPQPDLPSSNFINTIADTNDDQPMHPDRSPGDQRDVDARMEDADPAPVPHYISRAAQTDNSDSDAGPNATTTPTTVTGAGVLASLRGVLRDVQQLVIGRETLREIDDLMFEIRIGVHDAARRGG